MASTFLWALCGVAAMAQPAPQRPNVVFIFTDDHAAHAISAYGSKVNRTPNLDRMAREGALFTNFFCTNAICAPSRAVLLTGLFSHLNGHRDNMSSFDGSQPTFPKMLQEGGYSTAVIGKWHLESDPTGFDHWEILPGQGLYYDPVFINRNGRHTEDGYATDIITDKAIGWMQNRPSDKPFFLMVQHKAPHRNWQPAIRHLSMFQSKNLPEPPDLFDDGATRNSGFRQQMMSVAQHLTPNDVKMTEAPRGLDAKEKEVWDKHYALENAKLVKTTDPRERTRLLYQRYMKDYLRCIAAVDEGVGRILDYLRSSGLDDNTIVVYSSDQGFFLGDYGFYDKRWMYEPSLRTPLIVRWPGQAQKGVQIDALTQNIDFAPTFLEWAGVAVPQRLQGQSLVPLLKGQSKSVRDAIYYHYYESGGEHNVPKHFGVRTDRFKLVSYYETGEWELFDLQADPREKKNLHGLPSMRGVERALLARLLALQKQYQEEPGPLQTTRQALTR